MNIFVLSRTPKLAARYHCDKHVVKMVLESAQLLCTAHRLMGSNNTKLYKATHPNHPCTVWCRKTSGNYEWLYELFIELCREYTYRYGKVHMCETKLARILRKVPRRIPRGTRTRFALAMPDEFRQTNVVKSYRDMYVAKDIEMVWTYRNVPYRYTTVEDLTVAKRTAKKRTAKKTTKRPAKKTAAGKKRPAKKATKKKGGAAKSKRSSKKGKSKSPKAERIEAKIENAKNRLAVQMEKAAALEEKIANTEASIEALKEKLAEA